MQSQKDASVLVVSLINNKYDKAFNKYDINCLVSLTCKYYIVDITNTLQNRFFLDLGQYILIKVDKETAIASIALFLIFCLVCKTVTRVATVFRRVET